MPEQQEEQQGTTHILRLQKVNLHINMIKMAVPVCIIYRTQSVLTNAVLWRNAMVRSNASIGDLDENRLIVSYTIPLM